MQWTVSMRRLAAAGLVTAFIVSFDLRAVADGPRFLIHPVNPQATYSACAAVDVNRDGKLDIVSGGWWYEAPTWKRHFVRDVEIIRSRYDGYSHLPLDVNGDVWTDLISANYRSRSLYWIEHPGQSLTGWTQHVIDMPGPMETGRLVDVDGDGKMDILPNGTDFAAWWELVRGRAGSDQRAFQFVRHELPVEVAGHGVGFGDVNGDGRGDVIGPRGWLEAPEDPRRGRWRWHPEFRLNRDLGIPALVLDVDGDGDNDLVWGRGHDTGLYWMEQAIDAAGRRRWVRHAIDTSWSQAHSLLLADIDNDGRDDVVAGKRYMGHDGRDPGEHNPLVSYWYKFDAATRTWQRGHITYGGGVGFGLDPKAADLDADGDVDIVAAGRSGLYWLENRLIAESASDGEPTRAFAEAADYDDHSQLLVYMDSGGSLHEVKTPAQWALRREHILASLQSVMGPLPDPSRRVPLDVQIIEDVQTPHYTRRKLTFAAEPGDRVPAYLLIPRDLQAPAPAVLCLHQTTPLGKDELVGLGGRDNRRFAHELADRGFVCLVPDYPSFGEYEYDFQAHAERYPSGSMKAIWNNIRAVDLLESLPEVDPDRIACMGHSLGGHNSIFTAVFDLRLRAVISSCGFTAFHHYYDGNLAGWTSDRYMPRIRDEYGNDPDRVPFDFYELIAALAPRPVYICAPLEDANFEITGVRKVVDRAAEVYELLGNKDALRAVYPDAEHDFPDAQREDAYQWLAESLKR